MKSTNHYTLILLISSSFITSCSTTKYSKDIQSDFIPDEYYTTYDCNQIRQEIARVTSRLKTISGAQDANKKRDVNMAVVSWVLFWPALFAIKNEDQAQEIAQLKGQYDALLRITPKKCGNIETNNNIPDEKRDSSNSDITNTNNQNNK